MSLIERRRWRRLRRESRDNWRSVNDHLVDIVYVVFGLLGSIAVILFTKGLGGLGLGAVLAFVSALILIRGGVRLWRASRIRRADGSNALSYEEELKARTHRGSFKSLH